MFTLKKFLDECNIEGLEILNGSFDYSNIMINSISYQEYPLDEFARTNEIILSTVTNLKNDNRLFLLFLSQLIEKKTAALIYSTKGDSFIPAAEAINYATKNNLTIIKIPWEYRFADIIQFTNIKLNELEIAKYKEIQDTLFYNYFSEGTLDNAAHAVSGFLGKNVIIKGKGNSIKGYWPKNINPETEIGDYSKINISSNSFDWGELYMGPSSEKEKEINFEYLNRYVVFPLSLWFNKESIEDMTMLRYKNDFIWNLIDGNYDSTNTISEQGRKLGINIHVPYVCIAVQLVSVSDQTSDSSALSLISDTITEIENELIQFRNRYKINLFFANKSYQLVCFMEITHKVAVEDLTRLISSYFNDDVHLASKIRHYIGISDYSKNPESDFKALYEHAMLALKYSISSGDENKFYTYRDSQFSHLFSELNSNENIQEILHQIIRPILDYDDKTNGKLFETLKMYFTMNGNSSMTARALYLNRQSLLYRLEKIESLTNLSLNNHHDRLILEFLSHIVSDY